MTWKMAATGRYRLAHGLTAVLLAAAPVPGWPRSGRHRHTRPPTTPFCQPGPTMITWSSISKPWAAHHALQVVNDQPGSVTRSVTTT